MSERPSPGSSLFMHPDFRTGIDLFNRGNYFESQMALEAAVNATHEADHALAKAILLLAGAMHLYFNRGGGRGVLNLMRQTLVTLDELRPQHLGVRVDELFEGVQAYLEDLEARRSRQPRFIDRWLVPRIRISG
jgi:predicted metal-dependent hydrolase